MGPVELELSAVSSKPTPRRAMASGSVLRAVPEKETLETLVSSGRRLSVRERSQDPSRGAQERFYDLRDSGSRVGVVREIATPLRRSFLRRLWRAHGSLEAQLLDSRGQRVLLELKREHWVLASTMTVLDAQRSAVLGRVRRRFHPWRRSYRLEGPEGQVFATVSSPFWRGWSFPVTDRSGVSRAVIRKRWRGFAQDAARRGATVEMDFGEHGWTLEQRCVLLAVAIAIDLDSVESDAG